MHARKSLPDMRCFVWLHVPCVHHMVYGALRVHEVSSASDHQLVTVSACMNHAAGLKHLPFNHKPHGHKRPAAAHYSVSESDWVEESDYPQWFQLPFYPSVKYLLETGLVYYPL